MGKYIAIFDEKTFQSYGLGRHARFVVFEQDQQFKPCTDRGNGWVPREPEDFISMMMRISEQFDIDLNDPGDSRCICPQTCDCQDPDNGFKSNECPVHNDDPCPDPDCPADLHHNHLIDVLAGNYAHCCGATCVKVEPNSYVWKLPDGKATKDLSVWFAPNETIVVGVTCVTGSDGNNDIELAKTFTYELADPQLENKLKSLVDEIRNAS